MDTFTSLTKDVEKKQVVMVRRDTGEKKFVQELDVNSELKNILKDIQDNLYKKAKDFMMGSIVESDNYEDFLKQIKARKLVKTNFCGSIECEEDIKEQTSGATTRCIPFETGKPDCKCFKCDKPAEVVVYFSRNY